MDLLQIATGITKCDDCYKLRQYTVHCSQCVNVMASSKCMLYVFLVNEYD